MKKTSCGFIMVELLIGIVVLMGLMAWWQSYQSRIQQKILADRMANEINVILDAAVSYYYDNKGTFPDQLSDLANYTNITKNPFGANYEIQRIKEGPLTGSLEVKSLDSPSGYIARSAAALLPQSSVDNNNTVYAYIPPPGELRGGLVSIGIVSPRETITIPPCQNPGYKAGIFLSVASCGDPKGYSIAGCRAYAENVGDPPTQWMVHLKALTLNGWTEVDEDQSGKATGIFKIQAIVKCFRPSA